MIAGKFHTECSGFCMNPVTAANCGCQLVFKGPFFQCSQDAVYTNQQEIGCTYKLNIETCVQDI